MEFHYHPCKLDPGGNVAKMLAEISRGLDAAGKIRFVATLDLQEPVALLRRYAERGQLDTVPLLTVLLRLRDPELTAAVLAAPQLNERRVYYPSSSDSRFDSVEKILIREAMLMVDPDLLQAVADSMQRSDIEVGRDFAHEGRTPGFDSALYALASQADSADPKKVEACARWACAAREAFTKKYSKAAGSKVEQKERAEEQPKRNVSFASALLILAAKSASNHLARAALAMGAISNETAISEALNSGNPALSIELLKVLPKELGGNERLTLCENIIHTIGSLPERIEKERKDNESDKSRLLYCEPEFKKVAGDMGRVIEWALSDPASGNSNLGIIQRDLLGASLPLLKYFDDPELWMVRQTQKYPDPTPTEIASLAQARKWKKLDARLAEAEHAGVPSSWIRSVELSIASAALDSVKAQKDRARKQGTRSADKSNVSPENELDKKWFFLLAKKLSKHSIFKKNKRGPIKALVECGAYGLDEVLRAEAHLEAHELAETTPANPTSRTSSLRM